MKIKHRHMNQVSCFCYQELKNRIGVLEENLFIRHDMKGVKEENARFREVVNENEVYPRRLTYSCIYGVFI